MKSSDVLDLSGIAQTMGLATKTVRNYHYVSERRRRASSSRPGDMPPPDLYVGRSPAWFASSVSTWLAKRPGRGVGGGRPRKHVERVQRASSDA